jgi:glucose-6-phosphate 1-dehydrogenase
MKKSNTTKEIPSVFVIMGVTGDLAAKKIIPSLWHLFEHKLLPDNLSVIGFARRALSGAEFEKLVRDAVIKHTEKEIKEEDLSNFFTLFSYHMGTFEDQTAFRALATRFDDLERSWSVCANKLFYLATPPSSYESIFKNLAAEQLNIPCLPAGAKPLSGASVLGWSRILIEKPFGDNLATAQNLQSLISSYFKEEQIYRIDHYLFKEILQGIENFRFSNNLFENTWDNTTIERIDVRLLESIGVEMRGSFYDAVGALRDVGQNHLLAMLSAIAMEYPLHIEAKAVQDNRADVLEKLLPWTDKTLREHTSRAQYEGYKNITGVGENSETETFFAIKTELVHSRWEGIPIFMEAGKRMGEARKEIVITLKHPSKCLLCQVGPHEPNRIVFRLEPNDEIIIHFWMKKPGFERILEERVFSFFLYEKEIKIQYVEEYSKILFDAMRGEQTRFISSREVEACWKFIDPIVDAWKREIVPLDFYVPDSRSLRKIP